jgi:hypothetical protein
VKLVPVIAFALVAGCTSPSSELGDLPEPFTRAVAMRDCAPWDGAAVSILLTTGEVTESTSIIETPHLRVSVWRSPEALENVTIRWPEDPAEATASWCDNDTTCEAASAGVVRFREVQVDSIAAGEFRLAFAGRDSVIGGFRATWLHRQMMCG